MVVIIIRFVALAGLIYGLKKLWQMTTTKSISSTSKRRASNEDVVEASYRVIKENKSDKT